MKTSSISKKHTSKKNKNKHLRKRQTIKKLRQKKMRGGTHECPICLKPLDNGDEITTTTCKHQFHKECITKTCKEMYWNKNETCKCPMCRHDIDREIKKILPEEEQFDPNHLTMETFPRFLHP